MLKQELFSLEIIWCAWQAFVRDKKQKSDVVLFTANLESELWRLADELQAGTYVHGRYEEFIVHDPKRRIIHKAPVRDRVVHRLVYNYLLPRFNPTWLDFSFSCRPGFGQHRSIARVRRALAQATHNYTKEGWILKCDIKKFFDHIDHTILSKLVNKQVSDPVMRVLLAKIINSYAVTPGVGIPIGNVTSQIFANVYLHELDWFVKHQMRLPYYYRYADDFIILLETKEQVDEVLAVIENFVTDSLHLTLHPQKIIVRKAAWGIDWLGQVLCPGYEILRSSTKKRMMRKIKQKVGLLDDDSLMSMLGSYHGLLQGVARKQIDEEIRQVVALYR